MPQYNFLCRACKREFSKILTIAEHEKAGSSAHTAKAKT